MNNTMQKSGVEIKLFGEDARNLRDENVNLIIFEVKNTSVEGRDVAILTEVYRMAGKYGVLY